MIRREQRAVCGYCKWHVKDPHEEGDWYCNNEYSDYYTDLTSFEDSCADFEGSEKC